MKIRKQGENKSLSTAGKRLLRVSVSAILLLMAAGCAAPTAMTIKHEKTPSLSDPVSAGQGPKSEISDTRLTAALAELQRSKELSDQRTAAMLDLLKSKNMISDEEAALVTGLTATGSAAEREAAIALEANKSIEEIKEDVRSEVTNELLRQVWTINQGIKEKDKRLRFGGDIRVRYEKDLYDSNNADLLQPSNPNQLMNTKNNKDFFKYRVRFGAEAKVNDETDAVLRLSTGSTSNPVSTNSTMADFMNKDSIVFDLAYLKWQPSKSYALFGGRMPNPWFSSDLVWDYDLNFEGAAVSARTSNADSWNPFLIAGAFPLQQYDFSQHGKWLFAGQLGVEKKNNTGLSAKIGAAYYDFKNITGIANDPDNPGATDWTAPLFQQKGNTLFNISADPNAIKTAYASEFKELNVIATLDIGYWNPVHIILMGDYVKNLGFKSSDITERTGVEDPPKAVDGYQFGMTVGYPTIQDSSHWKVYFFRKYLEADAVVDAFTDSDFHLGGTNAKGWILGAEKGLAKNLWFAARWLTSDEISGPPLSIDVLLVDFNARF